MPATSPWFHTHRKTKWVHSVFFRTFSGHFPRPHFPTCCNSSYTNCSQHLANRAVWNCRCSNLVAGLSSPCFQGHGKLVELSWTTLFSIAILRQELHSLVYR